MATDDRDDVLLLINKRDAIEKEIRDWGVILTQNGVGMTDPLVDREGFPLAHIDIYKVRHARNKIICLQNDHKAIMKQIEQGLGSYYASTDHSAAALDEVMPGRADYTYMEPFLRVTSVSADSPADQAGMHKDDLVLEFGSINARNFKDMSTIAAVVQHSENVELLVRVRRDVRTMALNLRPRKWLGKGLLGCVMNPLDAVDR